jgi:16S rRNA (cytosine1407-C5)-methyltransferase
MLRSAYQLLKPGGVLVYSTCTIAPEENELPVDQLVCHSDAVIEPFTLAIPEAMPGLTAWDGAKLDPSLKGSLRIKPSLDMEAFFVCKIRKPK